MSNKRLEIIRKLRAGRPFVATGYTPPVIRELDAAGKLDRIRTGCATVYTLKGAN